MTLEVASDKLAKGQQPFNLIRGQWFLGVEELPNQAELDQLRRDRDFLSNALEEKHHLVMDLVDDRNQQQVEISQLKKAESLLHDVFEALDGKDASVKLALLRRRYDQYLGSLDS